MTLKEKVLEHWCTNRRIVRKSSGKWWPLVASRGIKFTFSEGTVRVGGDACAFCHKYLDCIGCPIMEKTEMKYCKGTPWFRVIMALRGTNKAAILRAMDEEIAFLEGL